MTPVEAAYSLSVVDRMIGWHQGTLTPPAGWAAFGMTALPPVGEQARFSMELSPRLMRGGVLPAGALGYLADTTLGMAAALAADVNPTGEFGVPIVTASMTVDILGRSLPPTGRLLGSAAATGINGDQILVNGSIVTEAGQVVATICGWLFRSPGRVRISPSAAATSFAPAADLDELLGTPDVRVEAPGAARLRLHPPPYLINTHDALHGGAGVVLADTVAAAAVASLPASTAFHPIRISCSYLRPAANRGSGVDVTAQVRKLGRTVTLVEATVLTDTGKPAMLAIIEGTST